MFWSSPGGYKIKAFQVFFMAAYIIKNIVRWSSHTKLKIAHVTLLWEISTRNNMSFTTPQTQTACRWVVYQSMVQEGLTNPCLWWMALRIDMRSKVREAHQKSNPVKSGHLVRRNPPTAPYHWNAKKHCSVINTDVAG